MNAEVTETLKNKMCLLIGPTGVGKTLLLKRISASTNKVPVSNLNDIQATIATVGTNLVTLSLPWKREITVREMGGITAPIWHKYFHDCTSVIFMIDVSNMTQVSAACILLLDALTHETLANKPFLITLNKIDLPDRMTPTEFDAMFHLQDTLQETKQPVTVIETSAISGEGINDVIRWIQSH